MFSHASDFLQQVLSGSMLAEMIQRYTARIQSKEGLLSEIAEIPSVSCQKCSRHES